MRFFSVVSKHETEYHILILLPSSGRKIRWRKNSFLICYISCVSFTNRSWNLELSSNLYWRRDREQKVEDTLWKIPRDIYIWPLSLVVYCPGKLMCLMGSGNYPSCVLWKKALLYWGMSCTRASKYSVQSMQRHSFTSLNIPKTEAGRCLLIF